MVKRAFVKILLSLAVAYNVAVPLNRDSAVHAVHAAYRKVILRVHSDKGGSVVDTQRLQAAKELWDKAKNAKGTPGRKEPSSETGLCAHTRNGSIQRCLYGRPTEGLSHQLSRRNVYVQRHTGSESVASLCCSREVAALLVVCVLFSDLRA